MVIAGAIEGLADAAVLQRLIEDAGASLGPVYGGRGKGHLVGRLAAYNTAARLSPWVVLIDLDRQTECAARVRVQWLPDVAPLMCFRIVVRAIEAWLLADPERLGRFLGVPQTSIPVYPETLGDPKRDLVDLARQSKRLHIREDMVPRPGSGRSVGPAYTSRLIEFVLDHRAGWRPEVAAGYADSLARCLKCIRELVRRSQQTISAAPSPRGRRR